jgi:hypothetical protein
MLMMMMCPFFSEGVCVWLSRHHDSVTTRACFGSSNGTEHRPAGVGARKVTLTHGSCCRVQEHPHGPRRFAALPTTTDPTHGSPCSGRIGIPGVVHFCTPHDDDDDDDDDDGVCVCECAGEGGSRPTMEGGFPKKGISLRGGSVTGQAGPAFAPAVYNNNNNKDSVTVPSLHKLARPPRRNEKEKAGTRVTFLHPSKWDTLGKPTTAGVPKGMTHTASDRWPDDEE